MDRPEAGTVAGSHVLVEGLDGISTRELTELLVHVVGARTRVVAEPDTKVLDFQGLLLMDLEKSRNSRCQQRRRVARIARGQLPFRLPLERLQGTTCDDTNDINANDFTAGFLDLVQLAR